MVWGDTFMKKRAKYVLIVLSVVLAAGFLAGGFYLKSIRDYKTEVAAITFTEIDLAKVEDGIYEGQCDTGVVRARVQVTVKNHTLESIELLEHDNGKGVPAEVILEQMVQNQTTDVDTVSGATCSSKVIRKAVEDALAKGVSGENAADLPATFAITAEDLVGPWHLAENENDAAIYDAFPGAMEFGSMMELGSDGKISLYIGADGGSGTYTISGNVLHGKLTNSFDGSAMTMDLAAEWKDGQLLLTMTYRDLLLCWSQGVEDTGKGS